MANNNNSVTAIEQLLSRYSEQIIAWADSEFAAKDGLGNSGAVTQINLGSTVYTPIAGTVSMPAYPTVTILEEADIRDITNKYDKD